MCAYALHGPLLPLCLTRLYADSLSTVLTSRLILNVRDPNLRHSRRISEDDSELDVTAAQSASYTMSRPYTLTQIEAGTVWSNADE